MATDTILFSRTVAIVNLTNRVPGGTPDDQVHTLIDELVTAPNVSNYIVGTNPVTTRLVRFGWSDVEVPGTIDTVTNATVRFWDGRAGPPFFNECKYQLHLRDAGGATYASLFNRTTTHQTPAITTHVFPGFSKPGSEFKDHSFELRWDSGLNYLHSIYAIELVLTYTLLPTKAIVVDPARTGEPLCIDAPVPATLAVVATTAESLLVEADAGATLIVEGRAGEALPLEGEVP